MMCISEQVSVFPPHLVVEVRLHAEERDGGKIVRGQHALHRQVPSIVVLKRFPTAIDGRVTRVFGGGKTKDASVRTVGGARPLEGRSCALVFRAMDHIYLWVDCVQMSTVANWSSPTHWQASSHQKARQRASILFCFSRKRSVQELDQVCVGGVNI